MLGNRLPVSRIQEAVRYLAIIGLIAAVAAPIVAIVAPHIPLRGEPSEGVLEGFETETTFLGSGRVALIREGEDQLHIRVPDSFHCKIGDRVEIAWYASLKLTLPDIADVPDPCRPPTVAERIDGRLGS